jgi:plasmid stabilization system protein ParE
VTYQVRITAKAEQDIEGVLRWYHDQSAPDAGQRWVDRLLAKIATLEKHPQRCRFAREAREVNVELRELLIGRRRGIFRILFVIEEPMVVILHIRHSARDMLRNTDLQ